jgi:hypothetical protein
MDSMGIAIDEKGVNAIMSAVDVDGGGVMNQVTLIILRKNMAVPTEHVEISRVHCT